MTHLERTHLAMAALMVCLSAPLVSTSPGAAQAVPLEPGCNVRMENPHFSKGTGGIIAKAYFGCDSGASQTYTDVELTLWTGCDSELPDEVPFTRWDCDEFSVTNFDEVPVADGEFTRRYVPLEGDGGHPNVDGFHRAWVTYRYVNYDGPEFQRTSQLVEGVL